jgi:hypothetical protein
LPDQEQLEAGCDEESQRWDKWRSPDEKVGAFKEDEKEVSWAAEACLRDFLRTDFRGREIVHLKTVFKTFDAWLSFVNLRQGGQEQEEQREMDAAFGRGLSITGRHTLWTGSVAAGATIIGGSVAGWTGAATVGVWLVAAGMLAAKGAASTGRDRQTQSAVLMAVLMAVLFAVLLVGGRIMVPAESVGDQASGMDEEGVMPSLFKLLVTEPQCLWSHAGRQCVPPLPFVYRTHQCRWPVRMAQGAMPLAFELLMAASSGLPQCSLLSHTFPPERSGLRRPRRQCLSFPFATLCVMSWAVLPSATDGLSAAMLPSITDASSPTKKMVANTTAVAVVRRRLTGMVAIGGESCLLSSVVIVRNNCVAGAPHYDPEGAVCANDGAATEAYCSYGVSASACARCGTSDDIGPTSEVSNWEAMKTACGSSGTVTLSDGFVMGTYTSQIVFSGKQLVIIGNSKTLDAGENG